MFANGMPAKRPDELLSGLTCFHLWLVCGATILLSKDLAFGLFQLGHKLFFAQAARFYFLPEMAREIVKRGFALLVCHELFVFRHRKQDGHRRTAALDDGVFVTFAQPLDDCAKLAPHLSP